MKYRSLLNFENLTDMKIIAVVVTHNRIGLLKKSIGALRRNKPLDEIIVVENGCTDGTYEWLEAQKDLVVIHQDNAGGSRGFHTGIKSAHERGAAWIWCMTTACFRDKTVWKRCFSMPDALIQESCRHAGYPAAGCLHMSFAATISPIRSDQCTEGESRRKE